MTDHISTTQQPVDHKKYGDGYDAIFRTPKPPEDNPDFRMSPDICSVCGETLIDGICQKLLEQQKERT